MEQKSKKRVIIVDDSNLIINKLTTFIEQIGDYTIEATGKNGNDAVQLYRDRRPDLLLLDISMPIKRGDKALDEILTEFPDANIVIVSAVRGDGILGSMNRGAKAYIEKPLKFDSQEYCEDFIRTLQEAIN